MATKASPTQRGRAFTPKTAKSKTKPAQSAQQGSRGAATKAAPAKTAKAPTAPKGNKPKAEPMAPYGEAPWTRPRKYLSGRDRAIQIRLSDHEYQAVATGAIDKGLTPSGFVAEAALAAATGNAGPADPSDSQLRQVIVALMKGANDVVRVGVNLNQAVAKLNATGHAPAGLTKAAAAAESAAARQDTLAYELSRALGQKVGSPPSSPKTAGPTTNGQRTTRHPAKAHEGSRK